VPTAPSERLMPQDQAVVPIKTFQAADPDVQEQLVPHRPGVYVWTHNVSRLLKADEPTVQSALTDLLGVVGRQQTKQIKPYYSVSVQDQRYRIHDRKRIRLHALISSGGPLGDWIAQLATQIQRPLYVGMALDLNQRINNHLTGNGSDLRRRLRDARPTPVDILDLSVTWMAAPVLDPDLAPQVEPADRDSESEASGFDLAGEGVDPGDGGDSSAGATPRYQVGSELDLTLKAAESLLIRLAMPMFNEKQD